jgi:hypothetical protein
MLLEQAISYAARSVLDVTPALLPRPTPCRGWNLDMLLRHASESLAVLHDGTVTGHVGLIPAAPDRGPAADPAQTFRDQAARLLAARAATGRRRQVLDIGDLPLPPSPWNAPEPSRSPCTDGTCPRHVASAGRSRTRWPPPCWRSPRCSSPKPAGTPCSAPRSRRQPRPAQETGSSPSSAANPRHHRFRQAIRHQPREKCP